MRAVPLTLKLRPNGHYAVTYRTQTGGRRTEVIPSGANLERSLAALHRRLNKPQSKGQ